MSHRTPPEPTVAAAWIAGAFLTLFVTIIGYFVLFHVVAVAATSSGAPTHAPSSVSSNEPRPPAYTPPVYVPPQPVYSPPQPIYTPPAPPPLPPAPHLTFTDVDDALKYVQNGQPMERRAAATYLESAAGKPEAHDKILAAARMLVGDESYRGSAMAMIKTAATKDDLPILREILTTMLQSGVANLPTGASAVKTMIDLLSGFGDKDSAPLFAQCLQSPPVRDRAAEALTALGAASEDAVAPLALSDDREIATRALKILAQVGTVRSTLTFHRAIYLKSPEIAAAAEAALKDFAARLNLKPQQYLYVVSDHYTIDPPAGFAADASYVKANSHQWTRAAPNRSVKSIFTMSVKLVPQGYTLASVPGTETDVGSLKFLPVEASQSNGITQVVHYQAVDGDYLIDIKITLDQSDFPAASAITTAVNSIQTQ